MPDEPAYKRRLREYAKGDLHADHLSALEQELHGTSDRAAAILYAALVENALVRLIDKQLRSDLNSSERRELLQTFDRKIVLAYGLRLIGPVSRADLDLIRFIRNQFAHSRRPLQFDIPEVADVCAALQFPDFPGAQVPMGPLHRAAARLLEDEASFSKDRPRNRYVAACHTLAYRMIMLVDAPPDVPARLLGAEPLS